MRKKVNVYGWAMLHSYINIAQYFLQKCEAWYFNSFFNIHCKSVAHMRAIIFDNEN